MLHVVWAADEKAPLVEVTSKFATRDRAVDLSKPGNAPALSAAEHKLYTSATDLIPIDGIVKETSDKITAGAASDLDKARRIYEWVVDNTFRNAKTRGCGVGDVAAMLKSGNLSGKCADLNALYVGLARAAGLPARDVYGLRVAPSKFGYKSLGAGSEIVTKAQHCRAEVYLSGFGWVPVDPADVRKVVLEEPPGQPRPRRRQGGGRAQGAVRRLGDELARLQRRARHRPARRQGAEGRLPHVSAGRDRGRAPRLPRSRQLQVHDHGTRSDRVVLR